MAFHNTVVELRVRNWWAVFFEDRTFCRLSIAFPLKMYSKFGQPKWILVGQMLKLVGKWPMAGCSRSYGSIRGGWKCKCMLFYFENISRQPIGYNIKNQHYGDDYVCILKCSHMLLYINIMSSALEIAAGHWPFSDQFQHLAIQNPFWSAKFTVHFQWEGNQ